MLQKLDVISAFRRIFSLKKDVGMRVNQSGKNCELCRQVDDGCTGRRSTAVIDALNTIAANDDQHVVARLRGDTVNERGGMDGNNFFGRRGRGGLLGEQATRHGECESEEQSRIVTRGVFLLILKRI